MPDLTPLKFQVAIQDDATGQLKKIEQEFENLKEKTIKVKIEGLGDLQNLLSALQHKQVENLGKDVASGIHDAAKGLQEEAQKAVRASLGKLAEDLVAVKTAIQHDNFSAFSTRIEKCAESVDKLNSAFEKFQVTIGKDEGMKNFMTGLGEVIRNVRSTMSTLEAGKNGGFSGITNVAKQSQKETDQWAESMRRAGIEATKLEIQIRKLKEIEARGSAVGVDTSKLQSEISKLEELYGILMKISEGSRAFGHTTDLMKQGIYQSAAIRAKDEAKEVAKNTAEKERNSNATQQLSNEEQRLAQALQRTTESARSQSQVLSDLKSMAMQYLSVWGAQSFIHSIIETGGLLEQQRLSIGAILGDVSHANDLFSRIKGLAVQSPFGVVELDRFSKQLTAYNFQYNELYDMTKRLADVSAATGTDVSRLALALGHVRSEGALTGYTLRQFAMNNVPMLTKLSERLSEIEGRIVTPGDVRGRVRNKEISYKDVEAVIKELTDEGGMFYNAQEVMSQALNAKFKNLRDSFDIMFGEIAESGIGNILKDIAVVMTNMSKNWQMFIPLVKSGALGFAVYKAAVLASNTAMGQHLASTEATVLSFKKKTAEELKLAAITRQLTTEEKNLIATSNALTVADVRVMMAVGALDKSEVLRLITLKKLTAEEARQLVELELLTEAEVKAAMGASRLSLAWKTLWASMKSGLLSAASFVFNGWNMAFAGLTAYMELSQHNAKYEEERAARLDALNEKSQEGIKNLHELTQTYTVGASSSMDNNGLAQSIDEMVAKLKDYSVDATKVINEAFATGHNLKIDGTTDKAISNVHTLSEQYEILAAALRDTEEAYRGLGEIKNLVENAYDGTKTKTLGFANPFDNDLKDDIKEYSNALKEYDVAQVQLLRHRSELNQLLSSKAGISNASQLDSKEVLTILDNLRQNSKDVFQDIYKSMDDGGKNALNNWTSVMKSWRSQLTSTLTQANVFGKGLYDSLVGKWGSDMNKWPQTWEQQVKMAFETTLASSAEFANLSIAEQDRIRNAFLEPFGIKVDNQEAMERINEVLEQMNALVGKTWVIKLGIQGASSMADINSIESNVKKYRATINKLGKGLAKKGYSANGKTIQTPGPADLVTLQDIAEYNEAVEGLQKAETALASHGLSLPEEAAPKGRKKGGRKTGGTKAYKDEFAKRWDERIRIMKEAYDWYDKWEKKVGNDAAIAETNSKYADIFAEWKTDKVLPMDFDVKQIADYTKYVEKIRDDALKRYQEQKNDKGKNNGQEALRVYRQAVSLLNDVKFDNFAKAAEEFKSVIDQTIEDLNDRWDMFNTVRNATGNVSLASSVAGFGVSDANARTSADAMRNELQSLMFNSGGQNLLSQIPLDINIDEEKLRKMFEQAIPESDDAEKYKEKIDGLIKAYQEWQKLQRKVIKEDVSVFANLIGSAVSYDAQIKKIRDKLRKQKESIANAVGADGKPLSQKDKDKATSIAQTQADWEELKLSSKYANIYNNAIAMSRKEFDEAADSIEGMLNKLRELELISPSDYVSEKEKLNKARSEWSTTGFLGERGAVGQFISGGYDGLTNYYAKRRDNASRNAAQHKEGSAENVKWKKESEHYGKLFDKMSKLSDSVKDVVTAFQTLQGGLNLITNLFESMGNKSAANTAGDAAGLIGGALQGASSLSALGPYGMAAGAAIGLATAAFQLQDKSIQREIDALQDNVDALEANTESIKAARERTLGFDFGRLRDDMSMDYNDTKKRDGFLSTITGQDIYVADKAKIAMKEYYSKNSNMSGYAAEYANLKEQREDYLKMYNLEKGKKNESQDALDEYQKKIAELDEQIRFFSQDLAKELFEIDIKGWADKLSDALSSAFENGENMAKAYKETVTSILQDVMNKMMQMSILEPMFQNLQDKLFGNANKNIKGVFDVDDPKGSLGKVTAVISEYFGNGGEGEKAITAATEFMTAFQRGVQNSGLSVLNESSNTLSSGIQGTSEETSDLLAGYVNALRQDVAVNRILFTQFVTQLWPEYIEAFASHVKTVSRIDTNVLAMVEMMRDGRGAIYDEIHSLRSRIDNVVNGNESFAMK